MDKLIEQSERAELIERINKSLGDDFDPNDCFYEEELLFKAASMLSAYKDAENNEPAPVYYVAHPDGTYSIADPQPKPFPLHGIK